MKRNQRILLASAALALILCGSSTLNAQTRITVGVTETIETYNPYGDSVSLLYGIWSEVTGPFAFAEASGVPRDSEMSGAIVSLLWWGMRLCTSRPAILY